MIRIHFGILSLALLLGACTTTEKEAGNTPTVVEQPLVSLKDSCSKVEAATPDEMLPTLEQWASAADQLAQIAEEGDLETKNALERLQAAVTTYESDPEPGQPSVDASLEYLHSLDGLADRCKAVGSSALQ